MGAQRSGGPRAATSRACPSPPLAGPKAEDKPLSRVLVEHYYDTYAREGLITRLKERAMLFLLVLHCAVEERRRDGSCENATERNDE